MNKLNTNDHLLKNAVSGSFTMDEVKSLLFYGEESRDAKIELTADKRHLDWAIYRMFESLNDTSLNRKGVEKLFWDRILALANYR